MTEGAHKILTLEELTALHGDACVKGVKGQTRL